MIGKLLLLGALTLAQACAPTVRSVPAQAGNAILPAALESDLRPTGQNGRWALLFSDEFEGSALDSRKWVTCYWWDQGGCTNLGNRELQWYQPANVTVANGEMQLTAKRQSIEGRDGTFDFTSGLVSTGRAVEETASAAKFDFQYGFVEMRARVPAGQGLLPAFWMLPSTHEPKPEIDIMEVLGEEPDTLYAHLHFQNAQGDIQKRFETVQTDDLSAGWHVYAIDWSQERIIWYLDGTEYWRYEKPKNIPNERMYILINLAVGGEWPGPPDESTKFPAKFAIDYVRVWQRLQ
jgi:beta-glucanase (GH16 family)